MTKRYDLSKIMRRAWELVKKAAMSISEGLRKAWREAKEAMEIKFAELKGSVKQIAWAADIRDNAIEAIRSIKTWYENVSDKSLYVFDEREIGTCEELVYKFFAQCGDAHEIIERRRSLTHNALMDMIENAALQRQRRENKGKM